MALMSAPSDKKVNWAQKCSLDKCVEWKESKGGAEVSRCRRDLFLGPLVCKAVGERRVQ